MDIAITKMSSKGQIVIPSHMREDLKEGEQFIIIKNKNQLILQKTSHLKLKLKEDLEFAEETNKMVEAFEQDPSSFR
ncbi:AbrB/MazE/SpoVT family DNA-binding domain-containing protein [Candidatus Woesearchaeota archaeon]|nr:AbrB/MazE/SpoVT family DNA-binding domain-containing protein [Candidatus Woesearchaeota archaeon]